MIEASNDLGTSPAQTLFNVIVPLSLPGVLAGIVLTLGSALAAWVEPSMLGGGFVNLLAIVVLLIAGAPAASARTIEVGTALSTGGFVNGGQPYRDALLRYDTYTPENAMNHSPVDGR